MGSNMKKSIFDEQTSKALKNWRMAAVKKKRGGGSIGGNSPPSTQTHENPFGSSPTPSMSSSLNLFKTMGHSRQSMRYDGADFSPKSSATHMINVHVDHQMDDKTDSSIPRQRDHDMKNENDFSFDKPVA